MRTLEALSFIERLPTAIYAYGFYLWKLIWPIDLAPFYPHPAITSYQIPTAAYFASFALFFILCLLAYRVRKTARAFTVAWLIYLVTLLPVSGILQFGTQLAADRYSYIPALAPFGLFGLFAMRILARTPEIGRWIGVLVFIGLIVPCIFLTRQGIAVWHDSISLWSHEMSLHPNILHPYYFRGMAYQQKPQTHTQAIQDYSRVLEIKPDHHQALTNRGILLASKGDYRQAVADFNQAITINPLSSRAFSNRGTLFHHLGQLDQALTDYQQALKLNPNDATSHYKMAIIYQQQGNHAQAQHHRNTAIALGLPKN